MSEIDELRAQLRNAFKARAMVYAAVYDELVAELGEVRAEAILKRAMEKVPKLCRIAGTVDGGTFAAAGFAFSADTWRPGDEGCCFLHIRAGA